MRCAFAASATRRPGTMESTRLEERDQRDETATHAAKSRDHIDGGFLRLDESGGSRDARRGRAGRAPQCEPQRPARPFQTSIRVRRAQASISPRGSSQRREAPRRAARRRQEGRLEGERVPLRACCREEIAADVGAGQGSPIAPGSRSWRSVWKKVELRDRRHVTAGGYSIPSVWRNRVKEARAVVPRSTYLPIPRRAIPTPTSPP